MNISLKRGVMTIRRRYLSVALWLFSPLALGNGVSVWEGEMPVEEVMLVPEKPEAYQPFTVVFMVEAPPGMTLPHAVHVEVIDNDARNNRLHQINENVVNEIVITHQAKATGANSVLPLAVEIQGLPPGNLELTTVALDSSGNAAVVGEQSLTIVDARPAQEMFLMISRDRKKFFLTASEEEKDRRRIGPHGGPGNGDWDWIRGDYFYAWPAEGPAPDAAVSVCRFYSAVADSYFHTADSQECQALQAANSGWEYQGVEFRALAPVAGACPAGTDPVWRLLTAHSDPHEINHRFTTLSWSYDREVQAGWTGEGIAFCTARQAAVGRVPAPVTVEPAYLTAGTASTAILSGMSGYAPYEPSNSRVEVRPGEVIIDSDFPSGGFAVSSSYVARVAVPPLEPGDYTIAHVGHQEFGVTTSEGKAQFTVYEAIPTTRVHTFFHPGINHYFATAGEAERQSVIASGWQATDRGFNVWSANGPAPIQAVPVCRFYSALVNSHFYTASDSECDYLQSFDSGWLYEGIAFQALIPRDDGVCPAGTQPVWRLFNNRQDQQDSNHRFVVGGETYRLMIADGWAGEGVAFCSPPASGPEAGQTPIGFVPG